MHVQHLPYFDTLDPRPLPLLALPTVSIVRFRFTARQAGAEPQCVGRRDICNVHTHPFGSLGLDASTFLAFPTVLLDSSRIPSQELEFIFYLLLYTHYTLPFCLAQLVPLLVVPVRYPILP